MTLTSFPPRFNPAVLWAMSREAHYSVSGNKEIGVQTNCQKKCKIKNVRRRIVRDLLIYHGGNRAPRFLLMCLFSGSCVLLYVT
jgi:hypothetical protein